jgi:hypothetical protein
MYNTCKTKKLDPGFEAIGENMHCDSKLVRLRIEAKTC